MLRSIGKQNGESVKSIRKKKRIIKNSRTPYGGKDLQKGKFEARNAGHAD